MNITKARKMINSFLAGAIVHLENGNLSDYHHNAMLVMHLMGFIRGRTNDLRSEECQIMHQIQEALLAGDLSKLWDGQNDWCELRHARMGVRHVAGKPNHFTIVDSSKRSRYKKVDKTSSVQSGGTG